MNLARILLCHMVRHLRVEAIGQGVGGKEPCRWDDKLEGLMQ